MRFVFIFFVVLSAISTNIFPAAPSYYFQKLFIYFGSIVFWMLFLVSLKSNRFISINRNALIFILFILGFQLIAYLSGFVFYGEFISVSRYYLLVGLLVFILIWSFHYYVLKMFSLYVLDVYEVFYKATRVIALLVILTAFFQQLYLLFPDVFDLPITIYAKTLEAKWPNVSTVEGLYHIDGSYVKTTKHLSGIFEEASELANFILVALSPFFIARLMVAIKYSLKLRGFAHEWLILLLLMFILILSKSSTGVLNLLIILGTLSIILFLYKKKVFVVMFLLVFISIAIIYHSFGLDMLASNFDKVTSLEVISTNSRYGISMALFSIFSENIIFGVGRGAANELIHLYLPSFVNGNFEVANWLTTGHFPILSGWGGLLAEYGVVVVSFTLYFIFKTGKKFANQRRNYDGIRKYRSEEVYFSYLLFIMYFIISMLSHFVWYRSYIILIFSLFFILARDKSSKANI